jgi:peptidyl-dipeptidase A
MLSRSHFGAGCAMVGALVLGLALAAVPSCSPRPQEPAFPKTEAGARGFLADAEKRLLGLWIAAERASWVQENFITQDTERIAADARQQMLAATRELALAATQFNGVELSAETTRKLLLLRTSLPLAVPADPDQQAELALLSTQMSSIYGKGKYCDKSGKCRALGDLEQVLAESRDPATLLDAWQGWRTISPPLRPMYERFVTLANQGASDLGFKDLGELWRSGYDMPPDAFAAEVDRLWEQVRPFYESLHCYVRARLTERYGASVVPPQGPIPAHVLGNMWAQSWAEIFDIVKPPATNPGYDLTALLKAKKVDAREMVRYGERFFTSLGLPPLPPTFWERSLFTKPADRDVVCHASAWDLDWADDLRIKMCIDITADDFVTIHHELGHNFYQRAYNQLDPLYRTGANDGFHEGIGDAIALSTTPEYLVRVGLLDRAPGDAGDLALLLRSALDKIAFLPFGIVVDQWRWKVFAGETKPESYNADWWSLTEKYQGVKPPVARSEADFDPGAKYHVPANTPYTRYFLAHILQFQFHRALCQAAGFDGPLHRCSIYGNGAAGAKLRAMLEAGASRPWPETLAQLTGSRDIDATAILDYYAPLRTWLAEQNRGKTCGW